jgi:conjugative transfer signal peptidase TraF
MRAGVSCAFTLAAVATLLGVGARLPAHLRWNLTSSLPRGLYLVRHRSQPPSRGSLVAFAVPEGAADVVFGRGYLPQGAFLMKRVAAVPGDRVCTREGRYEVNGVSLGEVFEDDASGRPLPHHSFCGLVPPDRYYVATSIARSFDSRYFGPLPTAALTERLRPLWTY